MQEACCSCNGRRAQTAVGKQLGSTHPGKPSRAYLSLDETNSLVAAPPPKAKRFRLGSACSSTHLNGQQISH